MTGEGRQFRLLLRNNSFRFLDNDLIPAGGDMLETLANVLGILAGFGAATSTFLMYKYAFGLQQAGRTAIDVIVWPDKQFLIAISMLVTGFAAVVAWNGFYPDRRDLMILGSLPLRMRTFFAAKAASIAAFLVAIVAAANVFPFVVFPICMVTSDPGARWFPLYVLIHMAAILAASAFILFSLLAVQGLLIVCLRHRAFQRISSYVQVLALLALLFFFVVPPGATPHTLARIRWAPPFWFVGLYQAMLGDLRPAVVESASIACRALGGSALLAAAAYAAGYVKITRTILEEPELAPVSASGRWGFLGSAARPIFGNRRQLALFHFIRRTLARDRKSRVIMTAYVSVGLGYFLGDFAGMWRDGFSRWSQPTPSIAGFSIVLTFATLLGMRALFSLPVDLQANWIFRVTETASMREYGTAVRRTMLLLGAAPVWAILTPVYAALWGWRIAGLHLLLLVLLSLIVVELSTLGFASIPFTCASMPGKANLKAKVPALLVLFTSMIWILTHLEVAALSRPRLYAWIFGTGAVALVLLIRSRRIADREAPPAVYEDRGVQMIRLRVAE